MKYLLIIFLGWLFISCKKTDVIEPLIYSEASYKMTITMNWTSPQFTIPAGAHFTTILGMVHRKDTFLWKENALCTTGLEDVAEVGNTVKMNAEIDVMIAKYKAQSKFQLPPPLIAGTAEINLKFTTEFPLISFASMIAPSPDWFIGISNLSLLENNKWVKELTANIRVHDAGTEQGDVFGYNNPATIPQQPVLLLTPAIGSVLANGNSSMAPMATVRFVKN